jgi:signal peptidase I
MNYKIKQKQKKNIFREMFEWIITIAMAVVVSLFIVSNIVSMTTIKEQSMEPTLQENNRVVVNKIGYQFNEPKRGDIIILNKVSLEKGIFKNMLNEGKDILDGIKYRFTGNIEKNNLIKRVIGVYGDLIDIQDGKLYINGKVQEEEYIKEPTIAGSMLKFPVEVPKDKVFVLGDNRGNSMDSRDLGFIDISQIKGKAFYRIFPFSSFGKIK